MILSCKSAIVAHIMWSCEKYFRASFHLMYCEQLYGDLGLRLQLCVTDFLTWTFGSISAHIIHCAIHFEDRFCASRKEWDKERYLQVTDTVDVMLSCIKSLGWHKVGCFSQTSLENAPLLIRAPIFGTVESRWAIYMYVRSLMIGCG